MCSLIEINGKIILWTSVGKLKVKGAKKITLSAIEATLGNLINQIRKLGFKYLHIRLKGFSKNKKSIVKSLRTNDIRIFSILDETAFPHNGCRRKKIRRV